MWGRMRLAALLGLACAAVDLGVKAVLEGTVRNPRSGAVILLSFAVAAALIGLVPRLPSRAAAAAAGIGAGGAVGNALSALVFSGGVPDPLLLTRGGSYLAFNLADVFALCSAVGLLAAAAVYVLRHPGSLFERL